VRVIAQVRYSPIPAVQGSAHIAPFQEAIRESYPVLQQEHVPSLTFSPDGVAEGREPVAWRFSSVDGAWRASLTSEFVALETTAYQDRADYLGRMEALLSALHKHLDPPVTQRIGMRYIAQVTGDALQDIAGMVRPQLHGLGAVPFFAQVRNALSQVQVEAPEETGQLLLRWGHLAAGATTDPNAIQPNDEASWILDIDLARTEQVPFDVAALGADYQRFANRLYAMFRWSVTDRFLEYYGGQV